MILISTVQAIPHKQSADRSPMFVKILRCNVNPLQQTSTGIVFSFAESIRRVCHFNLRLILLQGHLGPITHYPDPVIPPPVVPLNIFVILHLNYYIFLKYVVLKYVVLCIWDSPYPLIKSRQTLSNRIKG